MAVAEAKKMVGVPDPKKTWKETVREEQQLYYEAFGDRDWDCYEEDEIKYLERNVGHAMYGPPKELPDENTNGSTGYPEKELEHIRKVCATIKEHSKNSSKCSDSSVLMSVIFVLLKKEEHSCPVAIFRIPGCNPEDKSKQCLNQFVDQSCRVYKDWNDFLMNNHLPECTYCYPAGGVYDGDENDKVLLEFGKTPASTVASKLCSVMDTASSVVVVGGMVVTGATMFATVAPAVIAASTAGAISTGIYGVCRSAAALVDRGKHKQSIGVKDAEARNCWLSIAGNALGVASGQAVRALSKMTQNGQVLCKAGRVMVNVLNYGSLTVNGLGLINTLIALAEKHNSNNLTKLEVFQFASSVLFFTMSAVSIRTADAIISETQTNVISEFEASLRSNRHRRMFRRVAKQTRGDDRNTMQGNAKVIRSIAHIDNKDDFFAGLVRVQKQLSKSGAKVSLTESGLVEINGELRLHPMQFSEIDKAQRQVILDATKNLSEGTWTQERFNQTMKTFCQEQEMVFKSQRTETVASINEAIGSSKDKMKALDSQKNMVSSMNGTQVDTLTSLIWNFSKEHHKSILSVALKLSELLGFKRTAEFLRVVEFVVNYVQEVSSEMETKYQADLQRAQNSQGDNFNREQFDYEYHIQGNRMQHFITTVLTNYNTVEALRYLKAAFVCLFPPTTESGGNAEDESLTGNSSTGPSDGSNSDSEVKAIHKDVSSTENVCSTEVKGTDEETDDIARSLYTKHKDFGKADLSEYEIYMIAREVTGLYLYEGNASLFRDGSFTFVCVTDPHIEPVTVMVNSNTHTNTVTASIII